MTPGEPDRDVGGDYDVAIVGGGVQGACLFDRLADRGHRVLLCDGGDFAGGTSQASAMLVWGGLLYLKNGDLPEVARLSNCRDAWLAGVGGRAGPHRLSYVYGRRPHRGPRRVHAGLWLYWALARGRRRPPGHDRQFGEQRFLSPDAAVGRLRFEEGRLLGSDAQLVLDWLRPTTTARAINYCPCVGGGVDPRQGRWELDLLDRPTGRPVRVTARWVVNATGVWADGVNDTFGVRSPWRHLLAKGASLSVPRFAGHRDTLVFDAADADEGFSLVPWGPVSLWGSTEEPVDSPEDGHHVDRADVDQLLARLNRYTRHAVTRGDVVSLRCGVRGLVVRTGSTSADPIRLSKQWRVHVDADRPWVGVYGGKITSSPAVARRVTTVLERHLGRPAGVVVRPDLPPPSTFDFPGLTMPVPTAAWCRAWQRCRTLDDYLRRRTNVAQWVPRGGLGRIGEHRATLLKIARDLSDNPAAAVDEYERKIEREHDAVLGSPCERAVANV